MWPKTARVLRFGPFKLDLNSHELGNGSPVCLLPQQFTVLVALLWANGNVVSDKEIEEVLWPDRSHFGALDSIHHIVQGLRKTLGDEKKDVVERIRTVGYRIRLRVTVEDDSRAWDRSTSGKMLAVLPFEGIILGLEPSILDDMTGAMIRRFKELASELKVLELKDHQSVRGYDPRNKTDEQIGRDLKAHYLLRTQVTVRGDSLLQLEQSLVRASDVKQQMWSGKINVRVDETVPIPRGLAQALARETDVELTQILYEYLEAKQQLNTEGRSAYREGRMALEERTESGLTNAIGRFKQACRAVESDPNYARALAHLADSYLLLGLAEFSSVNPTDMARKAKDAIAKALEINENLAEAHAAQAMLHFRFEWDWQRAESEFAYAIALDNNYSPAHHWNSIFLTCMGRHEAAIRQAEAAQARSRRSAIISADSAWPYYNKKEYRAALDQCDRALEIDPSLWAAHCAKGLALQELGEYSEAIEAYEKAGESSPDDPRLLARITSAYALSKQASKAEQTLKRLRDLEQTGRKFPYFMSVACAAVEQNDKAIECLEKAFEQKSPSAVFMDLDMGLKNLWSRDEFKNLKERLGKKVR